MNDIVEKIEALLPEMAQKFPSVRVLYLFGSHAAQTATDRSDIDIAVYLDEQAYNINPLLDLEIGLFFEQRLGKNVDVVVMQKVSSAMQHHILASSIRLFERNPAQRACMELASFKEYVDAKHYIRRRMRADHG
ncbi:MAG: nucleotidyltransferase domain-containing protein [Desulfobacterota bacterium]|nr:nucleotidyltransferase domain-containing protein [Thermodesulfobacteriota bacterium]